MRAHGSTTQARIGGRGRVKRMPAKLRARATLVSFAAIMALAAAGPVAFTGAEAAGQEQLECGDTITTDTTLTQDLVDCPRNGVVIGADNVTLDLNGHTIEGDGIAHPVGPGFAEDFGVSIVVHDGITVMNGSIRQFETGLRAFGSRDIRLLGLATSKSHGFGIILSAANRILVKDSSVDRTTERGAASGAGLLVTEGGGPVIGGSRVSRHVRIVDCSFRDNADDGIRSLDSADSVIKGNLLSDNGGTGISWNGERSRLMRNRVARNRAGIVVSGSQNAIVHNRVSHSRRIGVGISGGLSTDNGRGNLLASNVITGAATNIRISGEYEPGRGGAVHTVIRGNRLRRADHAGLLVQKTARHTSLAHNSARYSQGDGFDVDEPTTKLSRNHAYGNGDLGIEAVRGVNDDGGNVARRNGDRRQCTHVVCR